MKKVIIKIKNYRCFGYIPQEIHLGVGLTGFIGLNNSGKSTILKMFYEFRQLWTLLSQKENVQGLICSKNIMETSITGPQDSAEIINHFNNRPIELMFIFNDEDGNKFDFCLNISHKDNSTNISIEASNIHVNDKPIKFTSYSNNNDGKLKIGYIYEDNSNTVNRKMLEINFISNFFEELSRSIYIPSFRNMINSGENKYHYDLATGTAFIRQWDSWKAGKTKADKDKITEVTMRIKELFCYESLEINASSDKNTMHLNINGSNYPILDVGSGLSQFIITFATLSIRRPTYIFIDEPELNLHPSLQLKFLFSIASYASKGTFFATHSLGLARSAENVFSVTNNGTFSVINKFVNAPDYINLLGELSFSSYKEIGADSIFFVEGPTDIRTIQEVLRKFNLDSKVLIMPLGGDSMINGNRKSEFAEIVNRLNVKSIFAWIDSERKSASESISRGREDFKKVCDELSIKCCISEKRAIENYFTQNAIDNTFPGKRFKELDTYEKLNQKNHWSKEDNWRIASAMTKEELICTDLGSFIQKIQSEYNPTPPPSSL